MPQTLEYLYQVREAMEQHPGELLVVNARRHSDRGWIAVERYLGTVPTEKPLLKDSPSSEFFEIYTPQKATVREMGRLEERVEVSDGAIGPNTPILLKGHLKVKIDDSANMAASGPMLEIVVGDEQVNNWFTKQAERYIPKTTKLPTAEEPAGLNSVLELHFDDKELIAFYRMQRALDREPLPWSEKWAPLLDAKLRSRKLEVLQQLETAIDGVPYMIARILGAPDQIRWRPRKLLYKPDVENAINHAVAWNLHTDEWIEETSIGLWPFTFDAAAYVKAVAEKFEIPLPEDPQK